MSASATPIKIDINATIRCRRWMNCSAVIAFLATVVSWAAIGLFLATENSYQSDAKNFFSSLNTTCTIAANFALFYLAYCVYCLAWEIRFSRDAVLFTTIGTFFMFFGSDRSPVAYYLIVPFGALFVVIAMNAYAAKAIGNTRGSEP